MLVTTCSSNDPSASEVRFVFSRIIDEKISWSPVKINDTVRIRQEIIRHAMFHKAVVERERPIFGLLRKNTDPIWIKIHRLCVIVPLAHRCGQLLLKCRLRSFVFDGDLILHHIHRRGIKIKVPTCKRSFALYLFLINIGTVSVESWTTMILSKFNRL